MKKILPSGKKSVVMLIAGNILILFLLLIFTEGVTSYLRIFHDAITLLPTAEKQHTKYDPDLGWVSIPNVHLPNLYGPGIYLKTNSLGFRNNQDFNSAVPPDKTRVICSGDSFTLGYGVDNDHTWCQKLTSLNPSIETVNMGQGGYGVDQAFLWFKRDAAELKHNIQLLAFITNDFYRMQQDNFAGYGKPVIKLENTGLVVENVPVPKSTFRLSWLTAKIKHILNRLNTIKFFSRLIVKLGLVPKDSETNKNEETRKVLLKIFEELEQINKKRSSRLVLVYLPVKSEIINPNQDKEWYDFIENASQALKIPFINVSNELQLLDVRTALNLFIPEGQIAYRAAAGHLNNQGNEIVAKIINEKLEENMLIPNKSSGDR